MDVVLVHMLFVGLAVFFAGQGVLRLRQARRDGLDEWAFLAERSDPRVRDVTQAEFVSAYAFHYGGRGRFYAAGALVACVVATPLIMLVLKPALDLVVGDLTSVHIAYQGKDVLRGQDAFHFFFLLLLVAAWAAVTWVFALRFHKTAGTSLDTLLLERRLEKHRQAE